jgi:hypothetical protein
MKYFKIVRRFELDVGRGTAQSAFELKSTLDKKGLNFTFQLT